MSDRQGGDLDSTKLQELFGQLSEILDSRGQTAQLFVVGGAAMASGRAKMTRRALCSSPMRSRCKWLPRSICWR